MTDSADLSHYEILREAIADNTPAALVRILTGDLAGSKLLVLPDEIHGSLGDAELDKAVEAQARQLLAEERSETRQLDVNGFSSEVFFESYPPPPLLLIFGAVHVAQALSKLAQELGFRVIVVDVRPTLATRERFPGVSAIMHEWPDDAIKKVDPGPNTYVAILSHDPKFDEPALLGSLETPVRYIGAVGSRSTNEDRRERLKAAGVSDKDIERIRGPIGLDIGASTPEEMAISILGEIIAVQHGRSGGPLRHSQGSIRAKV